MEMAAQLLHGAELTLVPMAPSESSSPRDGRPSMAPGWYDSSWDLRRGLEVQEDALPPDCLALFART